METDGAKRDLVISMTSWTNRVCPSSFLDFITRTIAAYERVKKEVMQLQLT
jgi:hypothetical protein